MCLEPPLRKVGSQNLDFFLNLLSSLVVLRTANIADVTDGRLLLWQSGCVAFVTAIEQAHGYAGHAAILIAHQSVPTCHHAGHAATLAHQSVPT